MSRGRRKGKKSKPGITFGALHASSSSTEKPSQTRFKDAFPGFTSEAEAGNDTLDSFLTALDASGEAVDQVTMGRSGTSSITIAEITSSASASGTARQNLDDHDDKNDSEASRQSFVQAILNPQGHTTSTSEKSEQRMDLVQEASGELELGSDASGSGKSALELLHERLQKRELKPVDHSDFWRSFLFRKRFYTEPRNVTAISDDEVKAYRKEHEISVRGRQCPRPITTWEDAGFSERTISTMRALGWENPFPIQQQALPTILSGRDVIGIAKTGSGKTLAFLAPMVRHVLDQPPLAANEGPIGLVMAPARELAIQIYEEARKLCKGLGVTTTCIYGGASVREQIDSLKRGSQIVVCTPGRMIDLLCMNAGRLISMRRVSFLVLDEADRMFDMGFEPQISMIMDSTRPDRQTVLFSATFPRKVEALARKVLRAPIEIVVGGRSVAAATIEHHVEVIAPEMRFRRLLQLMGEYYEKGGILIFVDSQKRCDHIFHELTKMCYPCLSLHSGKDQIDRRHSIDDFKKKVRTVMVFIS
eukprot:g5222.t1